MNAGIAWQACAGVAVDIVRAGASVAARAAQALIDLCGTARASEAGHAGAREGTNAVLACSPIQTWIRCTIIDVSLTVSATEARAACTGVASTKIGACTPVLAWAPVTFVNIHIALLTLPARGTAA